jgi:hypothetical protein
MSLRDGLLGHKLQQLVADRASDDPGIIQVAQAKKTVRRFVTLSLR